MSAAKTMNRMSAAKTMNNWIDISVPLRNGMVTWPGDAPFERTSTLDIASGDPCNLSQISTTAHIGTHMDAPRHYLADGAGMESMPLDASIGRARVIEIQDPEVIRSSELEPHHLAKGERVLFKTGNSARCWKTDHFQKKYIYIAPETAHYLSATRRPYRGRRLSFRRRIRTAEVQKRTVSCSKQASGSSKALTWSMSSRASMNWFACR